MNNMSNMRGRALASKGPVIFSKSLAAYYADDKEKREDNLQLQNANIDYALKVKQKESPIDVLVEFGQTVASVQKLNEARKKAKAKQELEDRAATEAKFALAPDAFKSAYNDKKALEYNKERILARDGDDKKYSAKMQEIQTRLKAFDEIEAAQDILNASASEQIYVNEMLARHANRGHTEATMLADPHFKTKYLADYSKAGNDSIARGDIFRQYRIDKLAHLDLNEKALAAIISPEFGRQTETFRGKARATAIQSITTQQDLKYFTRSQEASKTDDIAGVFIDMQADLIKYEGVPGGRFEDKSKEGGLSSAEQVKAYVATMAGTLALDGDIEVHQLGEYIDKGIESAPGVVFFKPEQITDLLEKARIGATRRLGVLTSRDTDAIGQLRLRKLKGEDISNELQLIENRNLVSKEAVEAVRNTKVETKESYEAELEDWEIELANGNIVASKEAAKLIKSPTLQKEVLDKIKLHEKIRERVNYNEEWLDLKVQEGMRLTLGEDKVLNQRGIPVRNDLLNFFRRDFQRRAEADPDNPYLLNESIAAVQQYWEANGGADKDQKAKVEGKFTAHKRGRYDMYTTYSLALSDRRQNALQGSTITNVKLWNTDVDKAWKSAVNDRDTPGTTVKERMVNTPGLLSTDDILGSYENGILSQETIAKARRIGVTGTSLLKAQFQELLTTKEGQDEVAKRISQDMIDNFPSQEEAFAEAIERTNNGDLLYLFYKVGPENWTATQSQRVRNEIAKQAEFADTAGRQDALETIPATTTEAVNQIEEDRRPETYTGPTY